MKNSLLLGIVLCALLNAGAQHTVAIVGRFASSPNIEKITLSYSYAGGSVTDSAIIEDGRFKFHVNLIEPAMAILRVRYAPLRGQERSRYEAKQLFLYDDSIQLLVTDSLKTAVVTGGIATTDFEQLLQWLEPFDKKRQALNQTYRELTKQKETEKLKLISTEMDQLEDEKIEAVYHRFLIENIKSPVALYALENYAGYDIDPNKIEPLFRMLPAVAQQSPRGKMLLNQIETAKKTAVGAMAMNFTQNDTLDRAVSLSDFRGKYVLVDFWASWCGPCRAENPNVVKAFQDYKDKGFTVLGVSLDQPGKKQAWLDAIHKDNLTWTQVSDLKFWDNAVAKQYGIRAIPQNVLVDPQGKIIAKNIRGEELNEKLAKVFK